MFIVLISSRIDQQDGLKIFLFRSILLEFNVNTKKNIPCVFFKALLYMYDHSIRIVNHGKTIVLIRSFSIIFYYPICLKQLHFLQVFNCTKFKTA